MPKLHIISSSEEVASQSSVVLKGKGADGYRGRKKNLSPIPRLMLSYVLTKRGCFDIDTLGLRIEPRPQAHKTIARPSMETLFPGHRQHRCVVGETRTVQVLFVILSVPIRGFDSVS